VRNPAWTVFPLVRAVYGAMLLRAPGAAIRLCAGRPASSRARAVARLLGARHLAQAALTAGAPSGAGHATAGVGLRRVFEVPSGR
jgi:hypothetical protein